MTYLEEASFALNTPKTRWLLRLLVPRTLEHCTLPVNVGGFHPSILGCSVGALKIDGREVKLTIIKVI